MEKTIKKPVEEKPTVGKADRSILSTRSIEARPLGML